MLAIPVLGRLRQTGCHQFEANLACTGEICCFKQHSHKAQISTQSLQVTIYVLLKSNPKVADGRGPYHRCFWYKLVREIFFF